MTFKPKFFWQAWCDVCEDIFPATRDAARTRKALDAELKAAGWRFRRRVVCPDCIEEERRPYDLTGRVFGRLTAVKQIRRRPTKEFPKSPLVWRCVCECFKVIEVRAKYLLNGNTRSCGCLQSDRVSAILKSRHAARKQQRAKELPTCHSIQPSKSRSC